MPRDQSDFSLASAELLDLANATHEVTCNLAVTLRRELLRENTNLRIDVPTHAVGATRVVRGTRLDASLTDLAQQPAPTRPVARAQRPASTVRPCDARSKSLQPGSAPPRTRCAHPGRVQEHHHGEVGATGVSYPA